MKIYARLSFNYNCHNLKMKVLPTSYIIDRPLETDSELGQAEGALPCAQLCERVERI